jgi:hypothetical protein
MVQLNKCYNTVIMKYPFILSQIIAAMVLKFSVMFYTDIHYTFLLLLLNLIFLCMVILSETVKGSSYILPVNTPFTLIQSLTNFETVECGKEMK